MRRTHWLAMFAAFGLGVWVGVVWVSPTKVDAQAKGEKKSPDLASVAADVAVLKSHDADQAHAMVDVAHHFSNLWFAGEKKNWPLADFYLSETKSHLRWAVRMKPIRKDAADNEIKLESILEAVENSPLKDLAAAIKAKDAKEFDKAYRFTLEGCYSCHKATGKTFLRLTIPTQPADFIIRFDPELDKPK